MRISTPQVEGLYQASKWLKIQLLCNVEELEGLFAALNPIKIYPLTNFVETTDPEIPQAAFLKEWACWIKTLQKGDVPTHAELKKILACCWTGGEDSVWLQAVSGGRYLVKVREPVLQVQAHFFTYSSVDGVFRPMSMGMGSIFWGIQISYPQIYQDPKSGDLLEASEHPNAAIFKKLRQWVRDFTRATPFIADGKKINVPIRLGKKCFSWIQKHPQLSETCHVDEALCES